MKWKFTKDKDFPNEGERVVCVAYDSSEVILLFFSTENFIKNKVRAWVRAEDIYYDFLEMVLK